MNTVSVAEQRVAHGLSPEMGPYVYDSFPLNLELPGHGRLNEVLLVVDGERFEVWQDDWTIPVLVQAGSYSEITPYGTNRSLTVADGLITSTSGGCGCGSVIKRESWRPDSPYQTASRA